MAAFHQIGHGSEGMLFEPELQGFRGAIVSPVNYRPGETAALTTRARDKLKRFDLWFDPQLYVPESERGQLRTWPYFPTDFETADLTQRTWWGPTLDKLAAACKTFSADVVCSPVQLPRAFANQYAS